MILESQLLCHELYAVVCHVFNSAIPMNPELKVSQNRKVVPKMDESAKKQICITENKVTGNNPRGD